MDNWFRVEVTDSRGQVVAIESEMLAGRDIGEEEERVIRKAIDNLAGFLGLPSLAAELEQAGRDADWLVWSNEHGMWWGPDRCGYTSIPDKAGRYSFDDAMSICRVRSWVKGVPPETMVHTSAVWFGNHRPHSPAAMSAPPGDGQ